LGNWSLGEKWTQFSIYGMLQGPTINETPQTLQRYGQAGNLHRCGLFQVWRASGSIAPDSLNKSTVEENNERN